MSSQQSSSMSSQQAALRTAFSAGSTHELQPFVKNTFIDIQQPVQHKEGSQHRSKSAEPALTPKAALGLTVAGSQKTVGFPTQDAAQFEAPKKVPASPEKFKSCPGRALPDQDTSVPGSSTDGAGPPPPQPAALPMPPAMSAPPPGPVSAPPPGGAPAAPAEVASAMPSGEAEGNRPLTVGELLAANPAGSAWFLHYASAANPMEEEVDMTAYNIHAGINPELDISEEVTRAGPPLADDDTPDAAPGGYTGNATFDSPAGNGGNRRRRRRTRRAAAPAPAPGHFNPPFLMQEVDQAAHIQEVFLFAFRATEDISFDTNVEVLRAAAKKGWQNNQVPAGGVRTLPGFLKCMELLRPQLEALNPAGPHLFGIPKLFWSLAKLEVGAHGEFFLQQASRLVPGCVHQFSTPEISNSLWGLAKLVTPRTRAFYDGLAMLFVTELNKRMDKMTSQCIANSVYSVAQLQLRSPLASRFLQACVSQIVDGTQPLANFTTQGVANTIWALAKMPPGSLQKQSIWSLMVQARMGSQHRLATFNPQELSMFAWAMGQFVDASLGKDNKRAQTSPAQGSIEAFIVQIAGVARGALPILSPQSISNVAYALCKVHALGDHEALQFIGAAAQQGTQDIAQWQPQAISNFCYVLGQLPSIGAARQRAARGAIVANVGLILPQVQRFAEVASLEAERRMNEFNWQDLSGIISALGRGALTSNATVHMVLEVVRVAPGHCHQMSTQSMLNILMNALEMGIALDIIHPMFRDVAGCIASRTPRVKDIDLKQWRRIQSMVQG